MIRFINNVKRKTNGERLKLQNNESEEFQQAQNLWIQHNQSIFLEEEEKFNDLRNILRLFKS